jgi:hypothetical protein
MLMLMAVIGAGAGRMAERSGCRLVVAAIVTGAAAGAAWDLRKAQPIKVSVTMERRSRRIVTNEMAKILGQTGQQMRHSHVFLQTGRSC